MGGHHTSSSTSSSSSTLLLHTPLFGVETPSEAAALLPAGGDVRVAAAFVRANEDGSLPPLPASLPASLPLLVVPPSAPPSAGGRDVRVADRDEGVPLYALEDQIVVRAEVRRTLSVDEAGDAEARVFGPGSAVALGTFLLVAGREEEKEEEQKEGRPSVRDALGPDVGAAARKKTGGGGKKGARGKRIRADAADEMLFPLAEGHAVAEIFQAPAGDGPASAGFASYAPADAAGKAAARLVTLRLDVVAVVSGASPAARVAASLRDAARLQLRSLVARVAPGALLAGCTFCPPALSGGVVSAALVVAAGDGVGEASALRQRERLHVVAGVPLERPAFRTRCAVDWKSTRTEGARAGGVGGARLLDVHRHVRGAGVPGGRRYVVDGHYYYHHYMQDRFNDDGWGCAYRTLQSVCSWLQLQGHADRDPPGHAEIQRTLVRADGKPREFEGSREWIGSVEVGKVLGELYGVEARTLFVASGQEVPRNARALARHFETQGTPVMIGGGQLAYGLLGVDYNESTGDVRFLILDPHYTGAEDVDAVVRKGWCAWKDKSLFLHNTFYNFCLPQRPAGI